MEVFVTGATGVLGRGVIPLLVAGGHTVRAMARASTQAQALQQAGAEPVEVDLFDREGLTAAVKGADAVVHLATKIPPLKKARRAKAWAENDRIRTEGTANLVAAASAAGVERVISQSIAFVYPDGGDAWIDEAMPLDRTFQASTSDLEDEVAAFSAAGGIGTTLRFGFFYGPDAKSTHDQVRLARRGIVPMPGPRNAYLPVIHTDDAASATAAALGAPAGPFNVVDDVPFTRAAWARAIFDAFGIDRKPRFLPRSLARVAIGPQSRLMVRSWRVSNNAFRQATGWKPRFPDVRTGWADVARRIDG